MGSDGLSSIPNASAFFLAQRAEGNAGSVVFPSLEGSRPVLVELQALVNKSAAAEKGVPPTRRAVGLDQNRLGLLLAVLAKKCRSLGLGSCNVYANAAGGLRLGEPALDLALVLAIASSATDTRLEAGWAACGEVGLGGEVRPIVQIESRLKELSKMGFQKCLVPARGLDGIDIKLFAPLEVIGVRSVREALESVDIPLSRKSEQKVETIPF